MLYIPYVGDDVIPTLTRAERWAKDSSHDVSNVVSIFAV